MYRGDLTYDQFRRYLTVLTRQEIIAKNDAGDIRSRKRGGTPIGVSLLWSNCSKT